MKKETALGIATLLLVLGVVVFYAVMKPVPVKAPGAAEAPALSGTTYTEHALYYDIAANYASSTPLAPEKDRMAIALMKKFVSDTIVEFKTNGDFENLTNKDIEMMGFDKDRKETLQINYLIASSPRTVSYIFTVYQDTLGAHGNMSFRTFTFDTTNGNLLSLADVFSTDAYLDTLSLIGRSKLPAIIGEHASDSFIRSGTEPERENFTNFFFDNKELVLLFPPYQVAPYSEGPQTLRIPLSQISSILMPEYR